MRELGAGRRTVAPPPRGSPAPPRSSAASGGRADRGGRPRPRREGSREGRGRTLARPPADAPKASSPAGLGLRARPIGGGGGRKERDEASFLSLGGGGFRTRTPSEGRWLGDLVFHLPAGLIVTVRNRGGGGLRGGTWREEQEPELLAVVWLGKK
ncbi:hypothetical protein PVAP13_8KG079884 [Panicum virgatum]|uniref:Uncharacterized protein n=1 Tax=Panicum virgatum TaxID=38727 RepID=A0A8T0PEN4_PANVG|nr:hypothetical protein PVAP13_8KG079884 [Panicum virgatum]